MNKLKFKQAYTLIEFLIVIGILSVSIGSILLILTSVIKGSNQANISAEVKQNGQYVLDAIEKHIRSASDVRAMTGGELTPVGGNANSGIILTLTNGDKYSIICFEQVVGASNGWIGFAKSTGGATVPPTNVSSYESLTNKNLISGVDVVCDIDSTAAMALTFNVSPPTSAAKAVVINFIVNQAINAPSRADFLANAQFRTTISLRDYQ